MKRWVGGCAGGRRVGLRFWFARACRPRVFFCLVIRVECVRAEVHGFGACRLSSGWDCGAVVVAFVEAVMAVAVVAPVVRVAVVAMVGAVCVCVCRSSGCSKSPRSAAGAQSSAQQPGKRVQTCEKWE